MSRLKRTTLIHFTSQVLVSVSGFLATFAIARLLGSDVLGKYALVAALVIWFSFPVAAVGSATTKRMSEGDRPGAFLGAGVIAVAVLVPVLVGAVLLGRPFFRGYIGAPVADLLAVLIAGFFVVRQVDTPRAAVVDRGRTGRSESNAGAGGRPESGTGSE